MAISTEKIITVRLDQADNAMLDRLARRLGYSPSDVLRYAIRAITIQHQLQLTRPLLQGLGRRKARG